MAWNDSFDAMVAADFGGSFLNASEFGDTVLIVQCDAQPRTISCQVMQGTTTIVDHAHHEQIVSVIHVMATDDPVTGISKPTVGDLVQWKNDVYDFMSVKTADIGAITVTFQKAPINQFGANKPPSL